jgi:hypothetical protein
MADFLDIAEDVLSAGVGACAHVPALGQRG